MRVLMLHNAGNLDVPSGEKIVFDTECRALQSIGIQVTSSVIDNRQFRVGGMGAKLMAAREAFWSHRAWRQVRALIRDTDPHVVHVHNVIPRLSTSVFAACHKAGVPVVQTLHNYRYLCVEGCFYRSQTYCQDCLTASRWSGIRHRCAGGSLAASLVLTAANFAHVRGGALFKTVDRFICVSQKLRDIHIAAGFPAAKMLVKYHGIPQPRVAAPHFSGRKEVLFVGRLNPAKGTAVLRELPSLLTDFKIRIVGAGPDMSMLKTYFTDHAVNNVEMLGRLEAEEVQRHLADTPCVLIPSTCPESFGLVAAEAMARGTPIVASNIGALTELLEQSGAGIVVPYDQGAQPFAAGIRRIAEDKITSHQMGMNGIQFAREFLSLDRSTQTLREIYDSVISERERGGIP